MRKKTFFPEKRKKILKYGFSSAVLISLFAFFANLLQLLESKIGIYILVSLTILFVLISFMEILLRLKEISEVLPNTVRSLGELKSGLITLARTNSSEGKALIASKSMNLQGMNGNLKINEITGSFININVGFPEVVSGMEFAVFDTDKSQLIEKVKIKHVEEDFSLLLHSGENLSAQSDLRTLELRCVLPEEIGEENKQIGSLITKVEQILDYIS